MALWAKIVDGAIVPGTIGELPLRALRLDTLEEVNPADRLRATGYYDLSTVTAADFPELSGEERDALFEDILLALAKQAERTDVAAKVAELSDLARDVNWDWIDAFCHPDVAALPFVSGQSPNAGANWGAPTAAIAADRLRLGVSLLMVELIRSAQAHTLTFAALSDDISTADVDAPPTR